MEQTKLDIALEIIKLQEKLIHNLQWKVEKYEKLMDELTGVPALHQPKPGSIDGDGTVMPYYEDELVVIH